MQFSIGARAQTERRFTLAEIDNYLSLTGDITTLPARDDYSPEKARRVPTALLGGLFSYLLGQQLPGQGAVCLKQNLRFFADVYANETVLAAVEVTGIEKEEGLISLRTICLNKRGKLISEGEALVMWKH